ncbi:hypothetical protein PCANC_05674 [Puccinia coronata f. sp. avenae]|uniref:Uncharacterized protein n=1 Tax=Puccinia coronata f. sp. avenae TaxID=200324 RepID=A0A2N5VXT6_9BASI|nr:hypothetical protein PCANC_09852 [Puccinia coronata f. sp. avenae]PLW37626.1 hypothetical protein PCASD_09024 [Puccinia coronata f. sp. avenae]PLW54813.1 hypothetical protein PCANC_05674 [Puccinia coronata f. sp. avenae]
MLNQHTQKPSQNAQPAKLARMAASNDPEVWPPSLNRLTIYSVARRPSLNRMAVSAINSDTAIRASFAGSDVTV